ncbi:hypothetical protein Tco_0151022 [Tanacetum coccineum]
MIVEYSSQRTKKETAVGFFNWLLRENILIPLDTWHEALGERKRRYPQCRNTLSAGTWVIFGLLQKSSSKEMSRVLLVESHLAIETNGHEATKENHWLHDGAYLMIEIPQIIVT